MPNLFVIAGPNGAGKSTSAPKLLTGSRHVAAFVNADDIAVSENVGEIEATEPEEYRIGGADAPRKGREDDSSKEEKEANPLVLRSEGGRDTDSFWAVCVSAGVSRRPAAASVLVIRLGTASVQHHASRRGGQGAHQRRRRPRKCVVGAQVHCKYELRQPVRDGDFLY